MLWGWLVVKSTHQTKPVSLSLAALILGQSQKELIAGLERGRREGLVSTSLPHCSLGGADGLLLLPRKAHPPPILFVAK